MLIIMYNHQQQQQHQRNRNHSLVFCSRFSLSCPPLNPNDCDLPGRIESFFEDVARMAGAIKLRLKLLRPVVVVLFYTTHGPGEPP